MSDTSVKPKNRLIVFFPGWGDPVSVLKPMAKRFEKEGYDTHIVTYPGLHGTRMSINAITKSIAPEIALVVLEYAANDQPVIFVGHSMGGLIAKELSFMCTQYVSLATPHRGTALASKLPPNMVKKFSPSAYDMIPGSEYLRGLESVSGALEAKPRLSLSGQVEQLVYPPSTTKFGDKHIIIPNVEHGTLPLSHRTFAEIYAWLTYEVFDELG